MSCIKKCILIKQKFRYLNNTFCQWLKRYIGIVYWIYSINLIDWYSGNKTKNILLIIMFYKIFVRLQYR